MTNKSHRLLSDYSLFEVKLNVVHRNSEKILYTAVVHVIGNGRTANLSRTAEDAARSWGAFKDPRDPAAIDHHLYDRKFELVSATAIAQVDGISAPDAAFLASTEPKADWD